MANNPGQPGQDEPINFDLGFDDEDAGFGAESAAARKPDAAQAQGAHAVHGRQPQPLDDGFDQFPEPGSDFGAAPAMTHDDDDGFGDIGQQASGPSAFDEQSDEGAFGADPVGDFDSIEDVQAAAAGDFPEPGDDLSFDEDVEGAEALAAAGEEDLDQGHDQDLEEEHEDGKPSAAASAKGLMSRFGIPVGAVAVLGLAGYFGWSMFSGIFDSAPQTGPGAVQPQQRTASGPPAVQMPQQGQRVNGQTPPPPFGQRPPTSPVQSSQSDSRSLPPLPSGPKPQSSALSPTAPQPSAQQVDMQQARSPAPAAEAVAPPAVQQPSAAQPVAPAQSASAVSPDLQGGGLNRPEDGTLRQIGQQVGQIASAVSGLNARIDSIERSGIEFRTSINARIDSIESRAAKPEAAPAAAPAPARPAEVKPAADRSAAGRPVAERRAAAKPARAASDDDEDARPVRASRTKHKRTAAAAQRESYDDDVPPDEPQPKPRLIGGYRLNGVSEVGGRQTAVIRTRSGLEEVSVGQTLPGAGEVRAIRMDNNRWVVVTSRGVIQE